MAPISSTAFAIENGQGLADNEDVPEERIGDRIRRLRTELGMSQDALGKATGLTGAAISKQEREHSRPQKASLQRYAEVLADVIPAGVDPIRYIETGYVPGEEDGDYPSVEAALRARGVLSEDDIKQVMRIIRALEREQESEVPLA